MPNTAGYKNQRLSRRLVHVRPVFHASYLVIFSLIAVIIGIQYVVTHAASGNTAVLQIQFVADGNPNVLAPTNYLMSSINHDIGNCYGWSHSWVWSNGNNTCIGTKIGEAPEPTYLVAPSIPGYTFQGWGGNCSSVSGNECAINVPAYTTEAVQANYHSNNPPPPSNPATPPSLSAATASTSAINLGWSAGTPANGGSVSGYAVMSGSTTLVVVSASARSYQVTGLGCDSSHSYYVQMRASTGNVNSNTASATTSACPVAAPAPTPAPTNTPRPTTTPGRGGSAPAPSPSPAGSGDTTPPTTPTNFAATQDEGGLAVSLQWAAATDSDTGVKGYNLDRSVDNATWTNLQSGITGTNYTDTGTQFGVHYYYRLAAVDNAGNTSGYATTDVITAAFQATSTPVDGQTITSSDNSLTVVIPASATSLDVACGLEPGTASPTGYIRLAGPYELTCKDINGTVITSFNQPVLWTIKLAAAQVKKYGNIEAWTYDSSDREQLAAKQPNTKANSLTFASAKALQAVAVGQVKHSYIGLILEVVFVIVLVLGGLYYIGLRRLQKQSYDDYLRRKYNEL